jgi:trehalose utilization protein
MINVTVWCENILDRTNEAVQSIYPSGMHETIASAIREHLADRVVVRTAWLDLPEHGLDDEVLASTDVMTWWGHAGHHLVDDAVVAKVHKRVLNGMGLVVLHSGHWSKIFTRLMGTTCSLRARDDDQEVVWTVDPTHPIAEGVPPSFTIPEHEMYGEFFDIPAPDELVFLSWFASGAVFRSGCCFKRGKGRIFYFSPGHETNPVYHQPEVRRVVANAVRWAYQATPSTIDVSSAVEARDRWIASMAAEQQVT